MQRAHGVVRRADAWQDQTFGALQIARIAGHARLLADGFQSTLHAAHVARAVVDEDQIRHCYAAASARPTLQARYASIMESRSPSSTPLTSLVSCSVRRSLTI